MTREYRKIGITKIHSENRNNRNTIVLADFYAIQPDGRKKFYRGIPGGYLEGLLDRKMPKVEEFGLVDVSAELLQTLDFVLQLEKKVLNRKKPIHVDDFLNVMYLRNGIISLKQLNKVGYKYNWKAA